MGDLNYTDEIERYRDRFWREKIEWQEAGDACDGQPVARINGVHYWIGREDDAASLRGFAGRRFRIKFTAGPHAGKVVETTNLWCQGAIPDAYRKALPDNAVFEPAGEG